MKRTRVKNEGIVNLTLKLLPLYGEGLSDERHEKFANEVGEFQEKMSKKYFGR